MPFTHYPLTPKAKLHFAELPIGTVESVAHSVPSSSAPAKRYRYASAMHDELSPIQLFFKKQLNSIVRRVTGQRTYYDAQRFTATDERGGALQFEILKLNGLQPHHRVLEIGCGCLSAGQHVINYLEPDRYAGIDPNEWLREIALRQPRIASLKAKRPQFGSSQEFDGSEFGMEFDFIFGHSILSHAAHWQFPLFLERTAAVLAPEGRIFASLILAEGNAFGNPGSADKRDSMDEEWVYPGISYFSHDTVRRTAERLGLESTLRHDLTEFLTKTRPLEIHDWFEFRKLMP